MIESIKAIKQREAEELSKMEQGAIVRMSCRGCESGEEHKKTGNKWVCLWCGHDEIEA